MPALSVTPSPPLMSQMGATPLDDAIDRGEVATAALLQADPRVEAALAAATEAHA